VTGSKHLIIGTAGHVDHGKTALIRALTGTDTDRLKEEQERGMSIDLGFTSFQLPSGRMAGVIDVPGHERFLKNMLAGAGGIDLVILVIAADEGVMPQTREHLDILRILHTEKGVVAITKADLVDEEWLELVREDIREVLRGSFLADAPMVPVSSITGSGLDTLRATIDAVADEVQGRSPIGPWRLPIDRVFTIGGFGTVVTGTLISGSVRVGERADLLPGRLETRVRGLQVHGASADTAEAGTRVALNLAGLDLVAVERGDVVVPPGAFAPTLAMDARIEVLASCPRIVKNRSRVRVYVGTAEVLARLTLLDAESLPGGQSGLVQLRLEEPAVCAKGDRLVLRFYSPMQLMGGGPVIDAQPVKHRRFDPGVLAALAIRERGTPDELVRQAVQRGGLKPTRPPQLASQLGISLADLAPVVTLLLEQGDLIAADADALLSAAVVTAAENQILDTLTAYHRTQPLRVGMSREELRSRLSRVIDARAFSFLIGRLEKRDAIRAVAGRVKRSEHEPRFSEAQEKLARGLVAALLREPFSPPSLDQALTGSGASSTVAREVWDSLVDQGLIVRVAEGIFFHRDALAKVEERVREHLSSHASMTASAFRDLIGSSRKYAVPLLEYLDAAHVTRRIGDERILL
jgi:selenocysteine-specific elongation factor